MKKLAIVLLALTFAVPTFAKGGHYVGGKGGSSHKGSHYKNARTNDHYTKRK